MFVFCCYGDIPQVSYSFVLTEMCKGTLLHWLNESLDQRQRTQSTRHKQDENFLAVSGSFVWMDLGMSLLLGHLMDCSPQDDHAQTHCPFRWSQAVLYRHCCAWKKESPSDFSWTWLTLLFIYLFGGGVWSLQNGHLCVLRQLFLLSCVSTFENDKALGRVFAGSGSRFGCILAFILCECPYWQEKQVPLLWCAFWWVFRNLLGFCFLENTRQMICIPPSREHFSFTCTYELFISASLFPTEQSIYATMGCNMKLGLPWMPSLSSWHIVFQTGWAQHAVDEYTNHVPHPIPNLSTPR